MLKIDIAILDTNRVICKNISKFDDTERGLLSQNILAQLRDFVEYIAEKIYAKGMDIDPNSYEKKKEAWEYIKIQGNLRFLSKFHSMLQKSVSHYTIDEGGSERLMLKYYEYLLKIKVFLKDTYNIDVLENIDEFPLNTDSNLFEYYEKIAEAINSINPNSYRSSYNDRYYIKKIKPFFIDHKIYYEVTYTVANDKTSKFDRVIAFTNLEILENYAVKLSVRNDYINILGKKMPINIIERWEASIRPCELNNFADIFGNHVKINANSTEYKSIMRFLTDTKMSLVDLINSSDRYYNYIKNKILQETTAAHFFKILDKCRDLVKSKKPGSNIIKYLLHNLNNKIIKLQRNNEFCKKLSNLYLQYGCIPFDEMPFTSSLIQHNPRIFDLFECIDTNNREYELLARKIKINTEMNNNLFTPISDIADFNNIDSLINKYNSHIYYKHENRYLERFKDHIYIKGYVDDTAEIMKKLKELAVSGLKGYANSVNSWLGTTSHKIDSQEKKEILKQIFEESHVALIYGSAGTGKSTMIDHISNFFNNENKIYLANTHPAVNNLRRKVTAANCEFYTIKKFLSKNGNTECDILIIDECSTVSNEDMRKVLDKAEFTLLILVGDIYQIESILFGNWFSIARSFVPKRSVFELTKPYRTTNEELLTLWDRVRKLDENILESMVKNKYTVNLDDSIFDSSKDDEIILCLNYDGLYGINNINRFLQGNNKQDAVEWGINIYKINDPILFNESERFTPLIYNNMKGKIIDIEKQDKKIRFDIELEIAINELQTKNYDFELIGNSDNGNSIIRFWVNKYTSTDEDNDSVDTIIPFQIAYAVSIHKAQGLEYKSVKIVITNEVEECITHNIFYTAITRAKEELKIYWSPETENKILKSFKLKSTTKDVALLKAMYGF